MPSPFTPRLALVPLTALALLGTAACGSTTEAARENAAGSAAPASSAPEAGTRTISTAKGEVEIPAQPKRIVSLYNTTAELIDLGVTPVGVLAEVESDYEAEDWKKISEIPVVGENEMTINFEQLAALEPDLIISTQRRDEDFGYEKLKAIAPTVFFVTDNPGEVLDALPKIADAVGKKDQAAADAAEVEKKIAAVKSEHADALATTTWDYVEGGPEGFVANGPASWPGLWMEKAGLRFSPVAVKERQDRGVRLSMEQISQLKSTTAIFHDADPAGELTPATSKLLSATGWKLLPAVKAGNVFPMKYSYQYSYEGAGRIVDQIDAALDDVKPTATPAAS